MSRIGGRPIKIEDGVKAELSGQVLTVTGEKGKLDFSLPTGIKAEINDNSISLKRTDNSKNQKSLHGLVHTLVGNMITDTKSGFQKELNFKGTGYRAAVEGNDIKLNMGYSHEISLKIPEGVTAVVVKNTIMVSGYDRAAVGQFAAEIRDVRPPEVYKGKGIKYAAEHIRKKAGKAAQSAKA